MSFLNAVLRIAGRDQNGITRAIKTDEEGKLQVTVTNGGTEGGGTLNVVDLVTGEDKPLTSIQDDNGNSVLRVVDAAPFIVELSQFDEARHSTVAISDQNTALVPTELNRKYLSIFNATTERILLAFDAVAERNKGIVVLPNTSYEMSAMKGNLFKGSINAIGTKTLQNIFDKALISQGGVLLTSHSTSSNRTKAYPIPVEPNTTYTIKVVSDNIRIRNIVDYPNANVASGRWVLNDTITTSHTFTTNSDTMNVAISFCKSTTTLDLSVEETRAAEIILVKHDGNVLITEGV